MRDHIRILGILNMVMGAFVVLAAIFLLLVLGSVATYLAAVIRNSGDQDAAMAAPIIASVGVGIAVFLFILAAPTLVGGWGLMHFRPWSRVLMIVLSVLHLFHIPLGTALGVYGLWVLFNNEARAILESGGAYQPAPTPAFQVNPNYPVQGSYQPPPRPGV